MKTAEHFARAAHEHGITYWPIRACSICGYQLAYLIDRDVVLYDPGCDCTYQSYERRSFGDLADHYNMQSNPDVVAQMDRFWRFR